MGCSKASLRIAPCLAHRRKLKKNHIFSPFAKFEQVVMFLQSVLEKEEGVKVVDVQNQNENQKDHMI